MAAFRRTMPNQQPPRPGTGDEKFRTVIDPERGGWYPPAPEAEPDEK